MIHSSSHPAPHAGSEDKRTRILIVTRERPGDEIFGLGRAMRHVAEELRRGGVQVELLDAANWSAADAQLEGRWRRGLEFVARRCGYHPALLPALTERIVQAVRARRLLRARRDFTHVWMQDPLLAAAYTRLDRLPGQGLGCRLVVSVHGLGSSAQAARLDGLGLDLKWTRLILRLELAALQHAGLVTFPSEAARQQLLRDHGLASAPDHWHVVGHGRPAFALVRREDARRTLAIQPHEHIALVIGRVSHVKRIDMVVEAIARLQDAGIPDLRLIVLGGQPTEDLSGAIASMSPAPCFVPSGDVPTYLAAADIYLSACAAESYGLANVEAMHAGVPCIAAAGGASPEVLDHGAYLCAPSVDGLASAAMTVLEDPALAGRLVQLGRRRCAELPAWETIGNSYRALLATA